MPLGIVIPSDERRPLAIKEFNSIEDYQSVLGGYVEAISAGEGGLSIFANEEGKLIGLPLNRRATLLWHMRLYPHQPGDVLAGDVVLVGPTNARGDTLDVPVALRDLLFAASTVAVESTSDERDGWQRAPRVFGDYFDASAWALTRFSRCGSESRLRVVARK